MIKVRFLVESDSEQHSYDAEVEVLPRIGDSMGFDEARAGMNDLVGDFRVWAVKHYHYWRTPSENEIVVVLTNRPKQEDLNLDTN